MNTTTKAAVTDLDDIVSTDKVIHLRHPGTDELLGISVTLRSVKDPSMTALHKRIANERLKLAQKGKNFTADQIETNLHEVLFASIVSWDWNGITWRGEVPVLNRATANALFIARPWIKEQIQEAQDEDKGFFQD